MKLFELDSHCGNCELIKYCGDGDNQPFLCSNPQLAELDVDEYIKLAYKIDGTALEKMNYVIEQLIKQKTTR